MATLKERIIALAQKTGEDIKFIFTNIGSLSALKTTKKDSLVNAINELSDKTANATGINDSATNSASTWSSSQINTAIITATTATENKLIGGAGSALDTFKELQDALGNDPTFSATLATKFSKKVGVEAQTFTPAEQKQACDNIGIGDPDTDFVAIYNTAKGV